MSISIQDNITFIIYDKAKNSFVHQEDPVVISDESPRDFVNSEENQDNLSKIASVNAASTKIAKLQI